MTQVLTRRKFTVDEFQRMAEAGILTREDRVELIEGEIVEMSPIGKRHGACVNRLTRAFTQTLRTRAIVSVQNSIALPPSSEPQPDVALLKPRKDFYASRLPEPADILLVVEVADTTADQDRDLKIPLYARSRIVEVWLVDLEARRVEVHRDPAGGRYRDVSVVRPAQGITPRAFEDVRIAVADVLA